MSNQAVFTSVEQEQTHKRQTQKYKYNYTYTVEAVVASSTTTPVFLTITQDADFMIEKITGSVFGPTDTNGTPDITLPTDFTAPGTTSGVSSFAIRGLSVQITDTGAARDLTNGFVPLETFLSPGYGIQMYLPFPVRYFARRNSRLRFDFRNQDTGASAFHACTITLNGYKYTPINTPNFESPSQELRNSGMQV